MASAVQQHFVHQPDDGQVLPRECIGAFLLRLVLLVARVPDMLDAGGERPRLPPYGTDARQFRISGDDLGDELLLVEAAVAVTIIPTSIIGPGSASSPENSGGGCSAARRSAAKPGASCGSCAPSTSSPLRDIWGAVSGWRRDILGARVALGRSNYEYFNWAAH